MIKWHNDHGRKDLPWQKEINPYRVWISEIMLQQTQVSTVIPYFEKFIKRFPDITSLSKANLDDVLGHWSGLGYYARARNLHKAAQIIVSELKSEFPSTIESLEELPGVGRSTAGAILSIAKQTPAPILDGNVKRVLARFHMITGYPENSQIKKYFWDLAEQHTPKTQFQTYTQAIMDLGAMLCTRSKPKCEDCPINHRCKAFKEDSVAEFPNKKPKKEKPKRSARFFIIRNNRGEVRMSPDLKNARAYVIPLSGKDTESTVNILTESSHLIRKALSKKIDMKFLPKVYFVGDKSFDYAEKIEKLIQKNK